MLSKGMAIICVLEGNDGGSSIEGQGTSWKSHEANAESNSESKQCGRCRGGVRLKRCRAVIINKLPSIEMKAGKVEVKKMSTCLAIPFSENS